MFVVIKITSSDYDSIILSVASPTLFHDVFISKQDVEIDLFQFQSVQQETSKSETSSDVGVGQRLSGWFVIGPEFELFANVDNSAFTAVQALWNLSNRCSPVRVNNKLNFLPTVEFFVSTKSLFSDNTPA